MHVNHLDPGVKNKFANIGDLNSATIFSQYSSFLDSPIQLALPTAGVTIIAVENLDCTMISVLTLIMTL